MSDELEYMKSAWTNGTWTVRWINEDQVEIRNGDMPGYYAVMDGGDFEYLLQAACAGFRSGFHEATASAKEAA